MSTPQLTVFLFGDQRFAVDGERITGFHSSKVAALGYYLAATGRAHTRDALAGLLWPDYASAQAKKNLRGAIYHLRNHLDDFLTVTRQEVGLLDGENTQVDCRQFEALIAQAAAEPDPATATPLLEEAVQWFDGDFLDGFHMDEAELFDEWQRSERERYRQMVMQAYSTLVRQAIDAVDSLSGIRHSTQLLALDPLNEDGHRGLMLLLAMDGRPSAALAQYEQCKQLLWDELGVEPDDETTALAERIRDGELSGLRFAQPLPRRRSLLSLPAELTPFVGREQEIEQIKQRVLNPETRLTTIVGPGGVGKSRLAIRVGSELAQILETQESAAANEQTEDMTGDAVDAISDGIAFVRLSAVEAGDGGDLRICAAILDALQIDAAGSDDLVTQLGQVLSERRLLLILDNFEQIQRHAGLLSTLLHEVAGLRLLVTSRLRLNVRGEQVIQLDGLSLEQHASALSPSPAIQFFQQSAMAISPDFVADRNDWAAIGQICRLVQGLPLAIELAAAWTPLLPCADIADQIEQNLDFLSNNMPDLPERHRSLRAIFDQSWRLLSEDEAKTLQRLSLFRGGFTHEAASAITGASLPTLLSLVDKSLIRRAVDDNDAANMREIAGAPRFEIPETIRQYAAEQLSTAGEAQAFLAAYAHFFAQTMADLSTELRGDGQVEALDRMAAEIDNLRVAFTWAIDHYPDQTEVAARFLDASTGALFDFLDIRGWFQEGVSLFAAATDAVSHLDPRLESKLRARQAWFLFHEGNHEKSRTLLQHCLTVAEETENVSERLFVLNYLSAVVQHMGDERSARGYLADAVALEEAHPDTHAAGITANIAAMVAFASGDLEEASRQCDRALHFKQRGNEMRGRTYALNILGRVFRLQGKLDQARRAFAQSLDIAEELGDPRALATAQQHLGVVALDSGQLAGARRQIQIALETFRQIGSRIETSTALVQLGLIDIEQESYLDAAERLQEALQIGVDLHSTPAINTTLIGIAQLWLATGDGAKAESILSTMRKQPALDLEQRAMAEALSVTLDRPTPSNVETEAIPSTLDALAETCAIQLAAFVR